MMVDYGWSHVTKSIVGFAWISDVGSGKQEAGMVECQFPEKPRSEASQVCFLYTMYLVYILMQIYSEKQNAECQISCRKFESIYLFYLYMNTTFLRS